MEILKLAELMLQGLGETMYMVLVSTSIAYVIGLPLGIVLCVTDKEGLRPNRAVNAILGFIVNMLRSVPFLILLVAIMPFTRKVVGTTIGSTATIVPLIVGSAPCVLFFVADEVLPQHKIVAADIGKKTDCAGEQGRIVLDFISGEHRNPVLVFVGEVADGTDIVRGLLGTHAVGGIIIAVKDVRRVVGESECFQTAVHSAAYVVALGAGGMMTAVSMGMIVVKHGENSSPEQFTLTGL